jgi:hypothetical protein
MKCSLKICRGFLKDLNGAVRARFPDECKKAQQALLAPIASDAADALPA